MGASKKPCTLDREETTEQFFRPVEGRYLDQALNRALFFFEQGLTERSLIMLDVLHHLEPENPRVTLSFAETLLGAGLPEKAKAVLRQASFETHVDEAALLKAIILIREQKVEPARERLEKMLCPSSQTSQRMRERAQSLLDEL